MEKPSSPDIKALPVPGSALVRKLSEKGFTSLVFRTHAGQYEG